MSNKEFKLSEIAKKLDLSFEGDPNYKVNSIKNLKEAGKLDISFYYSKKFKKDLEETNAGIVLLEKNDDYEIGELTFNFFLKTYLVRSKNILTDNTINIEQIKGPFDFFTGQWSVIGNERSSTNVSFDAEFKLPFILENIITDQVINDFCENALEAFVDKLQIKN